MAVSGVQRITKFAKYLPQCGWDVTVLTVAPRGYFAFDDSLTEDLPETINIVRTGTADPTRVFSARRPVELPRESTRKMLSRLSQFIFVPDNKIGWYPPAVRAARRIHEVNSVDVVLASAPPYTTHLIGRTIAREAGAPIVVDFRDDWLGNPRHTYPTWLHRAIQGRLESKVIRSADAIITINEHISSALRARHINEPSSESIITIPHGYDPQDFERYAQVNRSQSDQMSLLYSGVFYDAQTPDYFLRGLRRALDQDSSMASTVRAQFVGLVPASFAATVERLNLKSVVDYVGYVPHNATTRLQAAADVLWMTIGRRPGSEGISTGKLYEYFGTRRPILGLVPEGVARDDLREYGAGFFVEPDDDEAIARSIVHMHQLWKAGTLPVGNTDFIARYDRRTLTRRLSDILWNVVDPDRDHAKLSANIDNDD